MNNIIHFHPNKNMAKIFIKPLVDEEKKLGYESKIHVTRINKRGFKLKNFDPFGIFTLIRIFWKENPQIIISHNSISSPLILLMGRIFNTKHIIYFNHGVPFLGYQGFTRLILYTIEKINLLLTGEIITVSNNMKLRLKKLTQKKVSIIHNGSASGINLSKINEIKKRFSKRNKGEFNIGYIGRPNKRKGYNFTIELWKQYFANKKEYKLFIYGSSKKEESNIKNIFPMGFKNDMYESYSHLDCVILPSLHEGLSYTAIESCAFYCPVIANNIPGIQEIIKNKKNGFLINNPTLEKYASSIILTKNIIYNNFPNKDFCDNIARKYDRNEFLKYYSIFIKRKFNKLI